jgi:transposase
VTEVSTIGLDLAKMVFQVHGADASGAVAFRKTLRRAKVLEFFRDLPRCVVAMEACGGAHHWAREIGRLGHEVRLIPPIYVKPFVKRQKNDASDAEAICEAAQRPTMRFVAVKSESAQASAAIFRTRDLLVRQRTQLINAVRGQLTEYGLVAAKGTANLPRLLALVDEPGSDLPQATRAMLDVLIGTAEARGHIQDGRADHTPPAHHWCSGTGSPDKPTRAAARIMVGAHARPKATHAGYHRARKQDGANCLGAARAQRSLPSSRCSRYVSD